MRVEERDGRVRFTVRVQPRASRTAIAGEHADAIKIHIAAPPVEGAANAELIAFLAKRLEVAKSAVRIVRGERGRIKVVEVEAVPADRIVKLLG